MNGSFNEQGTNKKSINAMMTHNQKLVLRRRVPRQNATANNSVGSIKPVSRMTAGVNKTQEDDFAEKQPKLEIVSKTRQSSLAPSALVTMDQTHVTQT
jgi:hypothetical protein